MKSSSRLGETTRLSSNRPWLTHPSTTITSMPCDPRLLARAMAQAALAIPSEDSPLRNPKGFTAKAQRVVSIDPHAGFS